MDWVSFPGLGIGKIFLRDYAFIFFGIKIKWYAVLICFGILLALLIGLSLCKNFNVKKEDLLNLTTVGVFFGGIGSRLYYVVFNWETYSKNILSIFNLRAGGLAIYGAIIFSVLAGFVFCKIKNIAFLPVVDIAGICFLVGQAIGRWGNFVNIEAFGVKTNLPWGMISNKILAEESPVHPTFLYESLWCVLGFFVLLFLMKRRKFNGQMFLLYISWYSFGRFFIEGIRSDSLWLVKNVVKVSQLLSFILFFASVFVQVYILFFKIKKTTKPKN